MRVSPTKKSRKIESVDGSLMTDKTRMMTYSFVLAPWPEWVDSEVNADKWDGGLSKLMAKEKQSKTAPSNNAADTAPVVTGFENPLGHCPLPASIEVKEWKRASTLNPKFEVSIEELYTTNDLDLVTMNSHIMHSPIMRHIIANVLNLYHYAEIQPFGVEMESATYVPNGGRIWKPWHHVYGSCKVGKGTTHKPNINPYGKYLVRLFYMGNWRRVCVDDYLPVDEYNRVLLPMANKKEIWPMLLAKAVLRVAALTWKPEVEIVEMNVVTCLTGWFMQQMECQHVLPKYLWMVCQKVLMFRSEDEALRYNSEPVEEKKKPETMYFKQISTMDVAEMTTQPLGADPTLLIARSSDQDEQLGTVAVFGEMRDLPQECETLSDHGPCVGHSVLLSEARIITTGDNLPFPTWKLFRWKKWALKRGIIKDEEYVNLKSVRLYCPLKKIELHDNKLKDLMEGVKHFESYIEEGGQGDAPKDKKEGKKGGKKDGSKVGKGDKKSGGSKTTKSASTAKSSKSSKSSKSDKKKGKGKDKKPEEVIVVKENTDSWMDMNTFSKYLLTMEMMFRISCFNSTRKIVDVTKVVSAPPPPDKTSSKTSGKKSAPPVKRSSRESSAANLAQSLLPANLKLHRAREYFYLLIDTLTCKKVFFTMSILPAEAVEEQTNRIANPLSIIECRNIVEDLDFVPGYLICERYHWKWTSPSGVYLLNMKTVGTKTRMLQLTEGIQVLKIWCNVPANHCIQITSQSPLVIGTKDKIQDALTSTSASLIHYGTNIFLKFLALKNFDHESPGHVEAVKEFQNAFIPENIAQQIPNPKECNDFIFGIQMIFEETATIQLYETLKNNFDLFHEALMELQRLFLNPDFGLEHLAVLSPEWSNHIDYLEEKKRCAETGASLIMQQLDLMAKEVKGGGKSKRSTDKKSKSKAGSGKSGTKKDKSSKGKGSKKGAEPKIKCHILFDRQAMAGVDIIKKIVATSPSWLQYYPFRYDIDLQLAIADHKGSARVIPYQEWLPLIRYTVNIDHDETAFNVVEFLSTAPTSLLRIVNNDTLEELPNKNSSCSPCCITRNLLGYTIFAYGYSDNPKIKEHTWKLRIMSDKKENLLHCCAGVDENTKTCTPIPPQTIRVSSVCGQYIPNRRNIVLKCLLTIKKNQILSLRISFSNPQVQCRFKISRDTDASIVYETTLKGHLTIPSLALRLDDDDPTTPVVFLIDAELYRSTWTLTDEEKRLVLLIKEKKQQEQMVYSKTTLQTVSSASLISVPSRRPSRKSGSSLKSFSKTSCGKSVMPGSAYWTVQIVVDESRMSDTLLELNTRKQQEIRRLKEDWENADPGRHERAMAARENFLEGRALRLARDRQDSFDLSTVFTDNCIDPEQEEEWKELANGFMRVVEEKHQSDVEAFERDQEQFLFERASICQEQLRVREMLHKHYEEVRTVSTDLLNEAIKKRDDYIKRELAKAEELKKMAAANKPKGDKKGKNSKKDKKKKT